MKILVTGGSSGVGQACVEHLALSHEVFAPARSELDLSDFDQISKFDLQSYDVVINCAGANVGAYNGWEKNSWQNQKSQVDVNFTGALLLAKQYVTARTHGQFIYVTSTNIDDPIVYNIFYTASKAALSYSMSTVRKAYPKFVITEICPGKIKSNMLRQNFQDTKSAEEIESLYLNTSYLEPKNIASLVEIAIKYKLNHISISPYDQEKNSSI